MPEGPTILVLKNKLQRFKGKTVSEASGYGDMDKSALHNIELQDIDAFGKNLLFVFGDFFVGVHLGLFGSALIDDRKKVNASFALHFAEGEINFYIAKTKMYPGKPRDHFDFRTDVLKPEFDADFVLNLIKNHYADEMIGDAIIDQHVLAGVGNIIRVESLYRAKIHPQTIVKDIPDKKLRLLLKAVAAYSREFLALSKTGGVKKEALVYGKKICPKDKSELLVEVMGKVKRKTYVCQKCQKFYT